MADNRGLKNRIAMSNAIDKELYLKLKSYSEESGIPISKLLDKAISMLILWKIRFDIIHFIPID